MGLIESIRRWIDGETTDDILEEADEHAKPRRVWEEFLVKIAREVEDSDEPALDEEDIEKELKKRRGGYAEDGE